VLLEQQIVNGLMLGSSYALIAGAIGSFSGYSTTSVSRIRDILQGGVL
jgi:branched-subunit amino acid ABC-type transport system permease component